MIGTHSDITERKLMEEALRDSERFLNSTLAEKEVLLREVHHRVKNNLQAIISLAEMRKEQVEDPGFIQLLKELQQQARTMSLVYEQLYQSESLAQVEMEPYLQKLAANVIQIFGEGRNIDVLVDASDVFMDMAIAMPCGLVVNELLTNALKHAFPAEFQAIGQIQIELTSNDEDYLLMFRDNGVGLPSDLDWRKSRSLGLQLINAWVCHQLGGTVEVENRSGTCYHIDFSSSLSEEPVNKW